MLVVLPFENLSREPDSDYFSDGLTDEMIAQLGRLNPQKLGVIARTSAMRFKRTTKSVEEIGRELGVGYILEGSMRQVGTRVRITAQLVQVGDQSHVWADTFDRELKDILELQIEICHAIARQIQIALTPQQPGRAAEIQSVDPEVYQTYLKGRFFLQKRTADGLAKAVAYFEQAIAKAPDWPLAHAGLAASYAVMPANLSVRPSETYPKARAAALRALELDQNIAEAHSILAIIATWYDRDWETAGREHQLAVRLDPNYATGRQFYSDFFLLIGRSAESRAEICKALELDPVSLPVHSQAGLTYYFSGDYERAAQMNRKALELVPEYVPARGRLAKCLLMMGKRAEALAEGRRAQELSPRPLAVTSFVAARCGDVREAERILSALLDLAKTEYVSANALVFAYAGLGDREQVFHWMERAFQDRLEAILYTLLDPLLADLRSDPRHADLMRRTGLPPRAANWT
jgi:TolB-like protein/Tfp pilus assembly protein PilF